MSWREERAAFVSEPKLYGHKNQSQSQKKKSARSFRLFMFSRSRFKLSVSGWFGQYFIRIGYQKRYPRKVQARRPSSFVDDLPLVFF